MTAAPDRSRPVVYWDASAILSVLIRDAHSVRASAVARRMVTHLVSTLAHAEVTAVIARLERDRALPAALADAARQVLRGAPWRPLLVQPDPATVDQLASRWPLRGADLWHLATAATVARELPEVRLLTFDLRLATAAEGAGLAY